MKKFFMILAVVFGIITASAGNNKSHDVSVLPEQAQQVLKQNFKSEISHIKIGKEFGQIREYDVVMTDGSEIYFDKHGNWKEVEVSPKMSVPSAIIPNPIITFVKDNQKEAKVTGIEKKNYGYEVELSNGMDVRFTEKGKFIRYDD
ncbi:MAG: PepSY-like domain-containing protein [Muribaculaceae bacterium]|nr:PepSY-like domain-containing protein [Muribaculaceae bacterium]